MTLRPWVTVSSVALFALVGCALLGLCVQIPEPDVHDEFSYLLAADTFAHGRLANPAHPLWPHFESFHIIQQPTYASKYPPAQGAFLALGRVVAGHAVAGVWLSSALLCGAITWMLLAWLPGAWALAGGLLAAVQYGVAGDWSQSYWGGSVAAGAAALVYGAVGRLVMEPRVRDALWLGLGLVAIANSRPFEGLVAVLPVGLLLLAHAMRLPSERRALLLRAAVPPVLAILGLGALWMAYYNYRVTGSPLRMPYQVYRDAYVFMPDFRFGSVGERPEYNHPIMERYQEWEMRWYLVQTGFLEMRQLIAWKLGPVWRFFLGIAGSLPLLALPWIRWDRWAWLAFGTSTLLVCVTLFVTTHSYSHYLAPIAGWIVFLQTLCLRRIARVERGDLKVGAWVAGGLAVLLASGLLVRIAEHPRSDDHWSRRRAELATELESIPGKDLVIVRYGRRHKFHEEWVYNGADLDSEPVLFARSMGRERDGALQRAFPRRQAWLLTVDGDAGPVQIRPYPPADEPEGSS